MKTEMESAIIGMQMQDEGVDMTEEMAVEDVAGDNGIT